MKYKIYYTIIKLYYKVDSITCLSADHEISQPYKNIQT